jgi:predicted nucleic acid-binding protein
VTVVVDTTFAVAVLDADDAHHPAARDWIAAVDEDLVTSPLAIAEVDRFAQRGGQEAQRAFWGDLERGVYAIRWWADALSESVAIARRYPGIGLTDASLVAVAGRANTNRVATFAHHRFHNLTTVAGDPFVILPADAP